MRSTRKLSTSRTTTIAKVDRRSVMKGGGLLLTAAAAGGTFAPAVKGSTRAKAVLSNECVITGFTPDTGGAGTLVTIEGVGFDPDPDNHSVMITDQPGLSSLPVRAVEVQGDNVLVAEILHVPPGAAPGRVAVTLGDGFRDPFAVDDAIVADGFWAWHRNGPQCISHDLFDSVPDPATTTIGNNKAVDPLDPTKNCLLWDQPCPAGSMFSILCRTWAQDPGPQLDFHLPILDPNIIDINGNEVDATAQQCANLIQAVVQTIYNSTFDHPPGTDVASVDVSFVPGAGYEICIQLFVDPANPGLGFWPLAQGAFHVWPVA